MSGRHSTRASAVRGRVVPAVLAACLVATGIIVASLAVNGSGSHPPAQGAAASKTLTPSAGQPKAASADSASASASAGKTRSTRTAGTRQDPFGKAATSYLSTRAGTVLAAVYDVGTGQTWRIGPGQPQDEASVVKLDVLETLLSERNSNRTELSVSDRSLTQEMIEDSDNDAATSLWYEIGGAAGIRSFNAAAGLADTSPSSCVKCPGFPWPGWGLTTTTPTDQLTLLRRLAEPSSLLTSAERRYALSLMENVTPSQRWGVSGSVPPQVTVALKNGWLPLNGSDTDWQINSEGWISGLGRNYLMAVLSTGNPDEQYGIDTIDQLAGIVWNEMK
ncbi:MAG: serine hydrolase [Streptosporangiaceae bacterium]